MKRVILFSAPWCKSCVAMKPKFVEECKKLNVKYDIIDVESDEGVDLSIKYQIRNVPTMLVLKDKEVVGRESGSTAYTKIQDCLQ